MCPLVSDSWWLARRAAARTRFADLRVVAETGSTNADVLALARKGAREGVVLVADHQTAGRGRRDRRWEDQRGASLLVSILTRPATLGLADDQLHLVPTALGVAAADAARAATGADIRLKWPNDLVIETGEGSRKLSGILTETVVGRDGSAGGGVTGVTGVVVGIGINVNWPDTVAPPGLAGIAGALNWLAGRDVDRDQLLADLLRSFDAWYDELGSGPGRMALRARSRELSATIGRRVRVETPAGVVVGDALDVDDGGHLLVAPERRGADVPPECSDRPRVIAAGDVVHLRPVP